MRHVPTHQDRDVPFPILNRHAENCAATDVSYEDRAGADDVSLGGPQVAIRPVSQDAEAVVCGTAGHCSGHVASAYKRPGQGQLYLHG